MSPNPWMRSFRLRNSDFRFRIQDSSCFLIRNPKCEIVGGLSVAAEQPAKPGQPFDVDTVRVLAELMSKHDLSEIDMTRGEARLRLRRGPRRTVAAVAAPPVPVATPAPTSGPAPAPVPAPQGKKRIEIKSEAIGTFYARPKPDAKPYV